MAQIVGDLQLRHEMLAFLAVPKEGEVGEYEYLRMQGFTTLSVAKNPKEYSRQYVDEPQEQTDVTGYSPSMDFGFDKYVGNRVHDYIAEIIDNEILGTAAVVNILVIDTSKDSATENNATLRPYAVIADSEGDSMDAYTHSGTFAVKGNREIGKAVISDDGLTATWTPAMAA